MQKAAIDKCTLEIEIVQTQFPHHHPVIWIFGSIISYSKQLFPTSSVISWSHVNCRSLNQVLEVDISFSPCSVVLKVGSRWFSQVNWCWSSARAASVPVSTSCLWSLPASVRIGRGQGADSGRMAPKRATTLVLLVTIATQVSPTHADLVVLWHSWKYHIWYPWTPCFLDAIASPSTNPCQSVSGSFIVSDWRLLSHLPSLFITLKENRELNAIFTNEAWLAPRFFETVKTIWDRTNIR